MQFDQGLTRFLGPISLRKLRADSERKSPTTIITELASTRGSELGWRHVYVCSCWKTLPTANLTLEIEQGDRDIYRSRKARRECLFGRHSRGHYVSSSLPPINILHFNPW